jgi:hypothetical protein
MFNLFLIFISGGITFAVTLGKNRNVQKFFGHDLKKECECPPTKSKLPEMHKIKKSFKDKDVLR